MKARLLLVVTILLCTLYNAHTQNPVCPLNNAVSPTFFARDYNVFVKNNATLVTNESEGPVAIGGDLTLSNSSYQVAVHTPGNFKVNNIPIALLVGGKINYTSGNQIQINSGGYVKIGNSIGSTVWYRDNNNAASNIKITSGSYFNNPQISLNSNATTWGLPEVSASNNPVFQSGLIDFNNAFTVMQSHASTLAGLTNNASLTDPNGNPISNANLPNQVKINLNNGTNVLNITAADLNNVQVFTFNNKPTANRVLVINVNAPNNFTWNVWNQAGIGGTEAPFIIYNFYNTTNLNIAGNSTIEGTVFAPNADITKTINQSNIEGQVIGLSLIHSGGEMHHFPFSPTLVTCSNACALPAQPSISGGNSVCVNATLQLDGTASGGSWTSSNQSVATVNSNGVVTALSAGQTTITYTLTNSCGSSSTSLVVTVGTTPVVPAITGNNNVDVNANITLSNVINGGVWSSSNNTIATVNSNGVVSGIAAGSAIITYTVTNSCGSTSVTHEVNVNAIAPNCYTQAFENYGTNINSAQNQFSRLDFSAESRIGGGSYELDIHKVNPFTVFSPTQEFVWPNGTAVPFTVTYNPNASGNNKFIYTVGSGGNQKILYLDPTNPPSGAAFTNDFDGLWLFGRSTTNSTLNVANLIFNGNPLNNGINITNSTDNYVLKGHNLSTGFVLSGTVTYAWTGVQPTNSNMNFNIKIGKLAGGIAPIVNPLSGNQFICEGSTTTFSSTTGGGIYSSSNSNIATVNSNGVVTGIAQGQTTITYTVSNNCGTTSVTRTITVYSSVSTPTISTNGSTSLCVGQSVTLSSSSSINNQWYLNGVAINNAINQSYTATTAGNYTVIVGNSNCNATSSGTLVNVNTLPTTPTITGNNSICVNGGSSLLSSSAATGNQWYINGVAINGANNQTYTALQASTYTVTTNNGNCTSNQSVNFVVTNAAAQAIPTISHNGNTIFCDGNSLTLTSSYTNGNQWFLNGVAINGATNQTFTATVSGNYTVSVLGTNGCANVLSAATSITVVSIPANPIITGNSSFCNGGSTVLTSSYSNGNQWFLNGVDITGATNQTFTATQTGNYTVTFTSNSVCTATSAGSLISIAPSPNCSFTVNNNNQQLAANNFVFTPQSVGAGLIYNWNFGDNTTSNAANPSKTYSNVGTYIVTLTITNSAGCSNTCTNTVTVGKTSLPNAVVPCFTVNNLQQCITNNLFTFTNCSKSKCGCLTYLWNFGDGNTSTDRNPNHSYTNPGTYRVVLYATDDLNNTDSLVTMVSVITGPSVGFTINPTSEVCSTGNNTVSFTNTTGNASNMLYNWDLGNGVTATNTNPSTVYTQSGNYNITLTASIAGIANACTSTITKVLKIHPTPKTAFTTAVSNTNPYSINFTNNSITHNAAGTNYKWYFGDSNSDVQLHTSNTYAQSGIYTVILEVSNSFGCTDTTSKTIVLGNTTSANFTGVGPVCANAQPITFNNISIGANGSSLTYAWDFGDGTTSTIKNPSKTFTNPGNYLVTLTVTASNNDVHTFSQMVTVLAAPQASFTINRAKEACISNNNVFVFNNTSSVNNAFSPSYLWNLGNGSLQNSTNTSTAYGVGGSYFVTLTTAYANGCSAIARDTVIMYEAPIAAFSYSTNPNNYKDVSFANNTIANTPVTYNWNFNDGNNSSSTNPSNLYNNEGTYNVTLTATGNFGCTNTITKPVVIKDSLIARITIDTICQCLGTNTFYFVNASSGGVGTYTYLWNFGDGSTSTLTNPTKSYTLPGEYTVTLLASGATASSSTAIQVQVGAQPNASFTFTNTGNTYNFTNTSTISFGSITKYSWNFGDGNTSSQQNPTHTYTTNGTYTVTLIAKNAIGCVDTTKTTITIGNGGNTNCNLQVSFHVNDYRQCVFGNSYVLTNTTTGGVGPFTYWWDLNDGNYRNTKDVTHSYATYGERDIALQVTDSRGCTGYAVEQIYVGDKPVANFHILSPTGNGFGTYTFPSSSTVTLGPLTYAWDLGNGQTSTLINPSSTYTQGVYSVKLVATGIGTCIDSISKTITYIPNPIANFTVNTNGACIGSPFNFTSTSSTNGNTTYAWDFGDGSISTLQNPNKQYATAGIYQVRLTVTDAIGSSTIAQQVTAYPVPSASYNTILNTGNGDSYTFISTSTIASGQMYYSWNFGDATTSTLVNPTKSYTTSGNYNVQLTVTSDKGCIASIAKPLQVNISNNAGALQAGFSFTGNNCSSNPQLAGVFNFTNSTTGGTAPFIYAWNFGDGNTSSQANPTHTYLYPNNYNVQLTVTDAANRTSTTSNIIQSTGGAKPMVDFNIITNAQNGNSYTFISTSTITSGSMSYFWKLGDGPTSTLINPTYTYSNIGTYNVTLIVTGSSGCKDSITKQVIVNTLTTNSTLKPGIISISPNPVDELTIVQFRSASSTNTSLKLIDNTGRILQEKNIIPVTSGVQMNVQFNMQSLASGNYAIVISDVRNGVIDTKQLFKL